jgi:redox-sensing transcriptional repressor
MDTSVVIPEPTLKRLPRYHQLLTALAHTSLQSVSCSQIGADLGLDPTQVRKDLAVVRVTGKPNVGYSVAELVLGIEKLLGWNNSKDAFLAGAGNLGAALLGYGGFAPLGLNIVAAFDIDPRKIGTQVCGKHVLSLAKLAELARRMHVHIGIITVPAAQAQSVAHLMVEGGIRAIWNLAPVTLRVPDTVVVQNENLESSLAALSYKLDVRLRAEAERGITENATVPDAGGTNEL